MKEKKIRKIAGFLTVVTICVTGILLESSAFEKMPTQEKKVLPPDKLPVLSVDVPRFEDANLVVKFKIEAVGKTPVLITPNRLNVRVKMVDSAASGYNTKLLDNEKTILIQPNTDYSNELQVDTLEWSDGKHRAKTPVSNLDSGRYELKINYGGTKEGLLLGDFDFDSNVDSNIVQFEID